MAQLLEVSEKVFKIIVINLLKAVVGKVDNMQDQIGNISRDGSYGKESNGWKLKTQ